MTLSERMVEAAARALSDLSDMGWRTASEYQQAEWRHQARAALTAALAVAEAEEVVLCKVPDARTDALGQPVNGTDATKPWSSGHNACRAATLAGRVSFYGPLTLLTQEAQDMGMYNPYSIHSKTTEQ